MQAEEALASDPVDQARIFDAIKETVGFPMLNQTVKDQLRSWLLSTALQLVSGMEDQGMVTE